MQNYQQSQTNRQPFQANSFLRFQVFTGKIADDGGVDKDKSVGYSLLRQDQEMYSLKLWTFPGQLYYLITTKEDPMELLIMIREEKRQPTSNRKYNWSIVGNGSIFNEHNVVQLNFDLLPEPIFMSTQPDTNNYQTNLPVNNAA